MPWLQHVRRCIQSSGRTDIYRAEDLAGILGVLWSPSDERKRQRLGLSKEQEALIEVFGDCKDETGRFYRTPEEVEQFDKKYGFLRRSREHFRRFIKRDESQYLQILEDMNLVLCDIECRRIFGSEYAIDDESGQIGRVGDMERDAMPGYFPDTYRLSMNDEEQRMYEADFNVLSKDLFTAEKKKEPDPQFVPATKQQPKKNLGVDRALSLLSNRRLFDFDTHYPGGASATNVARFRANRKRHGLTFVALYARHEDDPMPVPPRYLPGSDDAPNPEFFEWFLLGAASLRFLCFVVLKVVVQWKKKLLVFCQWPGTQYHIDEFFAELGFVTECIHADMTAAEKQRVIDEFNSKDSFRVQVVFSTLTSLL